MKIFIVFIALLSALSIVATTKELMFLEKNDPEILRRVGIHKIDWWISCIIGVFRLAFGAAGSLLPRRSRRIFVLVTACFITGWIAAVAVLIFPTLISSQ